MINLNNKNRKIEEGFIVRSSRSKCGFEPPMQANTNPDNYQISPSFFFAAPQDVRPIPSNMTDVAMGYYSTDAAALPTFTINIKLSDLLYDSIFNSGDLYFKYGFYIEIEWNL